MPEDSAARSPFCRSRSAGPALPPSCLRSFSRLSQGAVRNYWSHGTLLLTAPGLLPAVSAEAGSKPPCGALPSPVPDHLYLLSRGGTAVPLPLSPVPLPPGSSPSSHDSPSGSRPETPADNRNNTPWRIFCSAPEPPQKDAW